MSATLPAETKSDITVEEKLRALYKLQLVDTKIDKIRLVRGELPLEVQDLEDELAGLETRINNLQSEVKQLDESIIEKKNAIKESLSLIAKYEAQQGNVRNNREFDSINKEILGLSQAAKGDFQELEKVVIKYGTVDRVATHQVFYYSDLANVGLVPAQSKHKTSIVNGLRKSQSSALDTPLEIQNLAAEIENSFKARATSLLNIIARIRERLNR